MTANSTPPRRRIRRSHSHLHNARKQLTSPGNLVACNALAVPYPSRSWVKPLAMFVLLAVVLFSGMSTIARAQTGETIQSGETIAGNTGRTISDVTLQPPVARKNAIPQTPSEILSALGWWFVIPFVIASVTAVWCASERIVTLRRRRVIPKAFVERFLAHLHSGQISPAKALEVCQKNGSPVAQVFAHGVRKWGKPSVEVEQAIIDGGERQISSLRRNLRILNGVATVTPLIGLLGTVIGMIQAFNEIANTDAMGKAQELAVGIALALLTTATGLMIAIPSLIAYMYLTGKVDSLVIEMDQLAQDVVHLVSAESLQNRPVPKQPQPGSAQAARTSGKQQAMPGKGRQTRAV